MSDRRKNETKIQKTIVDALTAAGIYCLRINSGVVQTKRGFCHLAPKGTPDVIGSLPASAGAKFFALEVKQPGEKLSPEQLAWRDMAERNGILHATVTSAAEALQVVNAWCFAERAA